MVLQIYENADDKKEKKVISSLIQADAEYFVL